MSDQALAQESLEITPRESPVRVCFLGRNNNGSWKIRGEQISSSRSNWKATREPTSADFENYDVFCMVKHVVPEWASRVRRLGKPLVYDVVDSWGQPGDGLKYNDLKLVCAYFADKWADNAIDCGRDYLVFPNRQMKSDLGHLVQHSTYLYHHAWPHLAPVAPRQTAQMLAYEGNEDYLGQWKEIAERVCAKFGLQFVINPKDWATVDIALAVRGGDHDSFMSNRYKSNVKLANMFAAGIPAIMGVKEASGHETDNGDVRFFSNESELESQIESLLDIESRLGIYKRFVAHSESFSLANISDQFERYFLWVKDNFNERKGENMGQAAARISQVRNLFKRVLRKVGGEQKTIVQDDPNLVRLNLGSGDKPLPGYLNVDIAPSRKGIAPDIVSDIRKLDLPDNYADEVLAVHLIEHLYYWELPDILKEWMRVLKPGGRVVLECPNILSAAKQLLEDPKNRCGPGKEGQTTMWPFYGDPGWKDPLMCHRWGYTPASLQAVLRAAGFEQISQQPAQFKRREPRDMRIVGAKPRG